MPSDISWPLIKNFYTVEYLHACLKLFNSSPGCAAVWMPCPSMIMIFPGCSYRSLSLGYITIISFTEFLTLQQKIKWIIKLCFNNWIILTFHCLTFGLSIKILFIPDNFTLESSLSKGEKFFNCINNVCVK